MINLPDNCLTCGADCAGGSDSKVEPFRLYNCGAKIWLKDVNKWEQYILVFNACDNKKNENKEAK